MNPSARFRSLALGLVLGTGAAAAGACTEGGETTLPPGIDAGADGAIVDGGPLRDGAATDGSTVTDGAVTDGATKTDAATPDAGPPPAGSTAEVANFGSNPGGLKMYLHTPGRVAAGAPIVVALHGCSQTAADYAGVGWDALADVRGFYVVYAEQTTGNNFNRCFRWYESAQTGQGGEAASIAAMVAHVRTTAGAGKNFVTGLSSGGAMAAAMIAAYPSVFEAASIDAGIPYRCATSLADAFSCQSGTTKSAQAWGDLVRAAASGFGKTRVQLWQGTADSIVGPTNLLELTKQWTNVAGISETAAATDQIGSATHKKFVDGAGVLRVETFSVAGMNHGAAVDPAKGCGQAGPYLLDVGLCSAGYAADFFGL